MADYLSSSEGVLVKLKDMINTALNVNPVTLKLMIDTYVSIKYGRATTKSHFDKVNTHNELTSDKMTIKVFFKYLRIVRIKKIVFKITVTNERDKEYSVETDFKIPVKIQQGDADDL